jgi:hypothetical protein
MKYILRIAGGLVLLAGFQLFILTEYTDMYFAWTIQPPLTAAFLGGGYFASFLMEILASRRTNWAEARIAVPAVFTFTFLTLIATLLHLNRFHFTSTLIFARAAAWFWLCIYAIVPPVLLVMWLRQHLMAGEDPPQVTRLPTLVRVVLTLQAGILVTCGIGLFAVPTVFAPLWPWTLTPLTSRAIGAWLIGIGIFAGHAVIENDYKRAGAGLVSYLAFALFELIALLRYPSSVHWMNMNAWLYLVVLLSILTVGLPSCMRSWSPTKIH